METTAVTQAAESTAASEGGTAAAAVFMGILAMVLIYAVTENIQRIAAAVDKLLGRSPETPRPRKGEEYNAKDIYEGEKCLEDVSPDNNNDKE